MRRFVSLVPLLLAVACSSGGGPVASVSGVVGSAFEGSGGAGPGPGPAPDYVVLSVSGRNFEFDLFCPPECNEAYIAEPGSAAEAVILDLVDRGYEVASETYIAALFNYDDDGDGSFDERLGFLQLLIDLAWIKENWIDGAANPTKIVLICHSHGCVWGHAATSVMADVPIEVLISLDGVCTLWEFDHQEQIRDYYAAEGGNPFPWDISAPCEAWDVPGLGRYDTDDVAFDNVRFNLEVRANSREVAQDVTDNVRLDGTDEDIAHFKSSDDNHTQVLDPTRGSMQWVLAELAVLSATPPGPN